MAGRRSVPVRPDDIATDREILINLQLLPDYNPANPAASVASLQELAAALDRAEEDEVLARRALALARERLIAARAAFHEAVLSAKFHVVAQYGDDSLALHAVNRKPKSERKRPARKVTPAA